MDLFLIPDNPVNTVLVSTNSSPHYRIATRKSHGRQITTIIRPEASKEESLVAEIDWRNHHWETATVLRSRYLPYDGWVPAAEFLYRRGPFGSSRYFVGDDGHEYQWKTTKTAGCILTRAGNSEELARYIYTATPEGLYANERKTRLRIQPACPIDPDLVVLSFIVVEKKRRDHVGVEAKVGRDEDPCGDGAGDGGGA